MNNDKLREALEAAPALSMYHGDGGFDRERFIADYEAWSARKRKALAASKQEPKSQAEPEVVAIESKLREKNT